MNKERKREYNKIYYQEHREQFLEYDRKRREAKSHPCPVCGKPISRHAKTCRICRWANMKGENNPGWKGGRGKTTCGYVWVYSYDHPRAGRKHQVLEHILVWEQANGALAKGWQVHHINGIRDDNRLENLIALPPKTHHHSSPVRTLLKKSQARIRELERQLNHENRLL